MKIIALSIFALRKINKPVLDRQRPMVREWQAENLIEVHELVPVEKKTNIKKTWNETGFETGFETSFELALKLVLKKFKKAQKIKKKVQKKNKIIK